MRATLRRMQTRTHTHTQARARTTHNAQAPCCQGRQLRRAQRETPPPQRAHHADNVCSQPLLTPSAQSTHAPLHAPSHCSDSSKRSASTLLATGSCSTRSLSARSFAKPTRQSVTTERSTTVISFPKNWWKRGTLPLVRQNCHVVLPLHQSRRSCQEAAARLGGTPRHAQPRLSRH